VGTTRSGGQPAFLTPCFCGQLYLLEDFFGRFEKLGLFLQVVGPFLLDTDFVYQSSTAASFMHQRVFPFPPADPKFKKKFSIP